MEQPVVVLFDSQELYNKWSDVINDLQYQNNYW